MAVQPKNKHTMVEVSCEGADLKDPPEAGLEIASLLLELHIALKTSDITTKFCLKKRKRIMCITYNKFCCCCCNVVTCSNVFAIIGLIGGFLNAAFNFFGPLLEYIIPFAYRLGPRSAGQYL